MKFISALAALATASAVVVPLVTFPGPKFEELNDPVMGGQSVGTWNMSSSGTFGIFDGTVKIVPALKAPGFIKAAASGTFADASPATGGNLVLLVRTTTPGYKGFRVAVASGAPISSSYSCAGGSGIPLSGGCYKAAFSVGAGAEFSNVTVPLNAFSDHWSSATGELTKTCAQDQSCCLDAGKLAKIDRIEVWGEGVEGALHLEVKSISVEA